MKTTTKTKSAKRWVIIGNFGLYVGQSLTRKDAIEEHCRALYNTRSLYDNGGPVSSAKSLSEAWEACQKSGDRVVKATITWEIAK